MLSGILSNPPEEITDTVPEGMLAKIQEFAVLVQQAVIDGINPDSIETTAKPAFALLDADGDGTLTEEEVNALANLADKDVAPQAKFDALFNMVDTDRDG